MRAVLLYKPTIVDSYFSIMVVLKRIRLNIVDVQESVIVGEADEMDKDNCYFCSNKFAKDKRVVSKFFITS